jgi:hypothetical protein
MLHPSRLGIILVELLLRHLFDPAVVIEKDGPGACRTLIERENILGWHVIVDF